MYNTGFGDCFLIKFLTKDGLRKVLIDCGKHTLSKCRPPLGEIVARLLQDIAEGEPRKRPRLDIVVATHRHQDHVSGFVLPGWDEVEVGEVWMPWTEDPDDPEARRICERQSRRALQLCQDIIPRLTLDGTGREYPRAAAPPPEADAGAATPEAAREHLLHFAGNNLTNADAMKILHEGFAGNPRRRFLRAPPRSRRLAAKGSDDHGAIRTERLPGVELYVLGPSQDPEVIRDMDPPAGEAYLDALGNGLAPDSTGDSPFGGQWKMTREEYFQFYKVKGEKNPLGTFGEKSLDYLGQVADNPATELAAALESSVNGTSLVLLFKFGQAVLLFPGDAQWGTWNEILSDDHWQPLLRSVTFYKVGHHGSHNATPRRFVEEYLPKTACAMIPTDDVPKWPLIPKKELLDNLARKGVKFVRSDSKTARDPIFRREASGDDTLFFEADLPC
jgi:hypothetical protein